MCGLGGYYLSSPPTKRVKRILAGIRSALAEAGARRGTDSWGVASIGLEEPTLSVVRGLGSIVPRVTKIPLDARGVMLHTRSRTVGEVSVRNSHPFSIGGILCAHNGVVSNWRDLERDAKANWTVDSQALVHEIAKGGDGEKVDAWGAVTWINESKPEEGTRVCRFKSGSLEIIHGKLVDNVECIVWSSVMPEAVKKALDKVTEFEVTAGQVYLINHEGIAFTDRKLKVGEGNYRSTYQGNYGAYWGSSTEPLTKGPKGEVYLEWDPCECGDPFYMHGRVVTYGGMCQKGSCQCKAFVLDTKSAAEINKQVLEAKGDVLCTCKHPKVAHNDGEQYKYCKLMQCRCSGFSLPKEKVKGEKKSKKDKSAEGERVTPTFLRSCKANKSIYHVSEAGITACHNCTPLLLRQKGSQEGMVVCFDGHVSSFHLEEQTCRLCSPKPTQEILTTDGIECVVDSGSGSSDVVRENRSVAGVGSVLEKLGKQAGEAYRAKHALGDHCGRPACVMNGRCLSGFCPRLAENTHTCYWCEQDYKGEKGPISESDPRENPLQDGLCPSCSDSWQAYFRTEEQPKVD